MSTIRVQLDLQTQSFSYRLRLIKVDSHDNSEYNPKVPLQIYHCWIDHSEMLGDNSQAYNIRRRDNAQSLLDKLVNTEHNDQYMQMNNV